MTSEQELTISAIMPAWRAEHLLDQVLPPLLAMRDRGELVEVIVVDDQSPDNTAGKARDMGATVIVAPVNGGPGAARNLAAEVAEGNILWLVDSDVVAREDNAFYIRRAFADSGVGALFGSYDDDPADKSWFSRYKNLVHHYYHQRGNRDATTFWAGCGAIRKSVYLALDGFDIETYKVPSIEDIDFGYRIRAAGHRIVLDPEMQCKHLKVWTVKDSVKTDIFKRAIPWARLMIGREGMTDDLNTGKIERARAALAWLLFFSLLALPVNSGLWPVTVGLAILAVLANFDLARFLYRKGGPFFALASMAYHQFYYMYASAAFAWCVFEHRVLGRTSPIAVTTGAPQPSPSKR
ncbi:MAG: glycosyltransferase [Marinibacterium sp.]